MPTLVELATKRVERYNRRVQAMISKFGLVDTGELRATARAQLITATEQEVVVRAVRPEYSLIQQHFSYRLGKIKESPAMSRIKQNPKAYRAIGRALKSLEQGLANDVADYYTDLFLTSNLII